MKNNLIILKKISSLSRSNKEYLFDHFEDVLGIMKTVKAEIDQQNTQLNEEVVVPEDPDVVVEEQNQFNDPLKDLVYQVISNNEVAFDSLLEHLSTISSSNEKSKLFLFAKREIQKLEKYLLNSISTLIAEYQSNGTPGFENLNPRQVLDEAIKMKQNPVAQGEQTNFGDAAQIKLESVFADALSLMSFSSDDIKNKFGDRVKVSSDQNNPELMIGDFISIPLVFDPQTNDYQFGVDISILQDLIQAFKREDVRESGKSENELQKNMQIILSNIFRTDFVKEGSIYTQFEIMYKDFKKVKNGNEAEFASRPEVQKYIKTYKFNVGLQSDILGLYHKFSLNQQLSPRAVDFIVGILSVRQSDEPMSTSSVFSKDEIAEILKINQEDGYPNLSSEDLVDLLDTKFPNDMVVYYKENKEFNEIYALQSELMAIAEVNSGATNLDNFCLTCGRFRQGGHIPEKGLTAYNRIFFNRDKQGDVQWKGAVVEDESNIEALSQWERNPIPSQYKDEKIQLTDLQKSFLSSKAIDMLENGCVVSFDKATNKPITRCKFVKNFHKKDRNKSVPIRERMGYDHILSVDGKNLTVDFNRTKNKGEPIEEEIWVGKLYHDFFNRTVEDLRNPDLNGVGYMANVPGYGPIPVTDLIKRLMVRMAKHNHLSFAKEANIGDYSPDNGLKVEQVADKHGNIKTQSVMKTDQEVITECSDSLFELFKNVEKAKLQKKDPALYEKMKNENTLEAYAVKRAFGKHTKFRFPVYPNTQFLRLIAQPVEGLPNDVNEKGDYITIEDQIPWLGFLGVIGMPGLTDLGQVVSYPCLYARSQFKKTQEAIEKELLQLITEANVLGMSKEYTEKAGKSIISKILTDAIVYFPSELPMTGSGSLSERLSGIKASEKMERNLMYVDRKKEVIREFIEEQKQRAEAAMSDPKMLEAWNLKGLNLSPKEFENLLTTVLYQAMSTLSPSKIIVESGNVGRKGKVPPALGKAFTEHNLTHKLETEYEGNKNITITQETTIMLRRIKDTIAKNPTIVEEIEKQSRKWQSDHEGSEDEYLKRLQELWKNFIYNKAYLEDFHKEYPNVHQDTFFDLLNVAIDELVITASTRGHKKEKTQEGAWERVKEQIGVPSTVIGLMQNELHYLNDNEYMLNVPNPEEVKGIQEKEMTRYAPVSLWFLKKYIEIAKTSPSSTPISIMQQMVEERRKLQGIRPVEFLNDETTAIEYIKGGIQKDLKKLIDPTELKFKDHPLVDRLKKELTPELQIPVLEYLGNNPEAYQMFFEDANAETDSFMPRYNQFGVNGYDLSFKGVSEKDKGKTLNTLATTAPFSVDDLEKIGNLNEIASDVYLYFKQTGERMFFTKRMRQLVAYLSQIYMSKTVLKSGGSGNDPEDYEPADKDITEECLYVMNMNIRNGSIAEGNKTSTPYMSKTSKGKTRQGIMYHYMTPKIRKQLKEHLGIDSDWDESTRILERDSTNAPVTGGAINWYKESIKKINGLPEKNSSHSVAVFDNEMKKFNWYKKAQINKKSAYSHVLVYSIPDTRIRYNNIRNFKGKSGKQLIPFSIIASFEDFGTLANVLDFNKKSSFIARAITRKEADIFRKMGLME